MVRPQHPQTRQVTSFQAKAASASDWVVRWFPLILGGYFLLHVGLRLLSASNLGLDEAEQIIAAQRLEWGYGPQPPLYSWLVIAMFSVFGKSLFALSLLKNSLLFLGYLGVWLAAKRIGGRVFAAVATASVFFLPQISWEAQRALSHSVLLFAAASWTVYIALLCFERPAWGRSVALGAVVAAGVLAKFNYFFLLAAICAAGLLYSEGRRFLLSRYALGAMVVAAAILVFPALWMVENADLLFSRVHKFGIHRSEAPWYAGPYSLGRAAISFVAVLLAVYLPVFFLKKPTERDAKGALDRRKLSFLIAVLVMALVLVFVAMLISGTTVVKDRWLQPTLFIAPVLVVGAAWSRLSMARSACVFALAGVCCLAIVIALPINMNRESSKGPSAHRIPSAAIADRVRGKAIATVLGEPKEFIGAVGYHLDTETIASPEYAALQIPFDKPVLLIWRYPPSAEVPQKLKDLYERLYDQPLLRTTGTSVHLPYKGYSDTYFSYYELMVPAGDKSSNR